MAYENVCAIVFLTFMKSPAIDGFWHCVRLRDGSAAKQLDLPATAAGVVVLFAAMPTGANACIFGFSISGW